MLETWCVGISYFIIVFPACILRFFPDVWRVQLQTRALVNLCIPSMAILPAASETCCGTHSKCSSAAWRLGVYSWHFVFAISRGSTTSFH
jgi:hypothetical protein